MEKYLLKYHNDLEFKGKYNNSKINYKIIYLDNTVTGTINTLINSVLYLVDDKFNHPLTDKVHYSNNICSDIFKFNSDNRYKSIEDIVSKYINKHYNIITNIINDIDDIIYSNNYINIYVYKNGGVCIYRPIELYEI